MNYKVIIEIIVKSGKEALRGWYWKWLFGSFPALCAVLLFAKNFLEQSLISSIKIAAIVIGLLIGIRFILRGLINSFKYLHELYKESSYGDAIIRLKQSFGKVHYYRKTPGYQDPEFMESVIDFCNGLKEIFDKITNSDTSVSIKVPTQSHVDERTVLKNLCRDSEHYKGRNTTEYNNASHTIIGNTCFSKTLNNVLKGSDNRYYINNDIENTKDYENTSKGCFNQTTKLPYKSEIVHAIVPLYNSNNSNMVCHGFLCIDSNKINAFDEKYAIAIIEGVADGIYDIITERNTYSPQTNTIVIDNQTNNQTGTNG